MDNMLLEKYASVLQKQAHVKAQQEYDMEKQSFALLGKGLNLAARGLGKATKWGANAVQHGAKAMQKGIGRAGNWAQHAGAAADQAIANGAKAVGSAIGRGASAVGSAIGRGASALGRGALAAAKNPWVQGAAVAAIPGYGLYKGIQGVRGYMQEHDALQKRVQELEGQQFQQPAQQAQPTYNPSDQIAQWGGTLGNMPMQQPAGLPPGAISSFAYNQFGQ